MSAPPALANILRPHGEYAIIGPGGGVDVLRAVANGSPSVTGIEINPIIANTVMRGRYADYSYHLYERPEVHIQVTDGRSFVRNAKQNFDVVQMTLVDTWASTAAGAFALSENSLYTVEAFREYFEHLKPDGMVAITRWEFRQPREAYDDADIAEVVAVGEVIGLSWFEIVATASYLGAVSGLAERVLSNQRVDAHERALLGSELEAAQAALDGAVRQRIPHLPIDHCLLASCSCGSRCNESSSAVQCTRQNSPAVWPSYAMRRSSLC